MKSFLTGSVFLFLFLSGILLVSGARQHWQPEWPHENSNQNNQNYNREQQYGGERLRPQHNQNNQQNQAGGRLQYADQPGNFKPAQFPIQLPRFPPPPFRPHYPPLPPPMAMTNPFGEPEGSPIMNGPMGPMMRNINMMYSAYGDNVRDFAKRFRQMVYGAPRVMFPPY